MKIFHIILLSGFCVFGNLLLAQNDCSNSLYEGNKLFELGKFQECITKLENCLPGKTNREELLETYHLLAQSYQNIGNIDKTNYYIQKMLSKKHDYQKYPNIDPVEFSQLVNKFYVTPKLIMGLKFGFNRNAVDLIKSYCAYASTQKYLPTTGFQAGITAEYMLAKTIGVHADLFYTGLGINHIVDDAGGWTQNYKEQQNYFLLNISALKHFKITQKLNIYAGAGIGAGYLSSTSVFFESTNNQTKSTQQSTQNPISTRNRMQPCATALLGLSTPLAEGTLSLETNLAYFFSNTVNSKLRMSDLNFIFNNQYVNDDVSLRTMMLNISYKSPIVWQVRLKK